MDFVSKKFGMILLYGFALAIGAFLMQWLEYHYFLKTYPTEFYIAILATIFVGLGIWIGSRLTPEKSLKDFKRNEAAITSLGLSVREYEVLEHLAIGKSNKEIARDLHISPNTIKTHVSQIFQKLDVQRRAQAVQVARELHLVP